MAYPVLIISDLGSTARLEEIFDLAAQAAINLEEPIAEITADLFRIEEVMFSSGGRRGGGSWKPLADSTVKRKGGNTAILRATDDLYNSLTEPEATGQILDISRTGIIFGTDRPWAAVHQYGSVAAHIPRRTFLRILPGDVNRWAVMLIRHLERAFKPYMK